MSDLTARQRAEMPAGTANILNRRSLQSDFRRLDQFLEPGQSVLDVGCGTGAITVGIAEKVAGARVVGLDSNLKQIEQARATHLRANLKFVCGDIYDLLYHNEFDVVACARVLQ